jgi:hypothetical protein
VQEGNGRLRFTRLWYVFGMINVNRNAMRLQRSQHLTGVCLNPTFIGVGIKRGEDGAPFPHSNFRIGY